MSASKILQNLDGLSAAQLKRLLVEQLTRQKLGLYWESDAIARDHALNANVVLPRLVPEWSHGLDKAEALAEGAACFALLRKGLVPHQGSGTIQDS